MVGSGLGRITRGEGRPTYIEGAWLTKHGGRYYLQYGAPGTEFNVYATGTYVSDKPLGPFEYAPYNPVGYKPGGFVHGAGHGNTFQDEYGNWWNTGTPWIGYNWTFERRIALFPAAFKRRRPDEREHAVRGFPSLHAGGQGLRFRQPVHGLDAAVLSQVCDRVLGARPPSRRSSAPVARPTRIRAPSGSRPPTKPG